MRKRIAISIAVVSLLLIGIMATSVFASNATFAKNASLAKKPASNQLQSNAAPVTPKRLGPVNGISPPSVNPDVSTEIDVTELEKMVPSTYEDTDALVSSQRTRFLLYTHDGKHIMWGYVGNGYFVGQDNLGKRCWGIYGNGVFAGFYDGEFFWGRYRNGNWRAEGLFGLNYAHGKYILFPSPSIVP